MISRRYEQMVIQHRVSMQAKAIKSVSEEFRKWIEMIGDWASHAEKKEETAISALLDALSETMIYLGRVEEDPEKIKRDDEESLSRLWKEAAKKVRPYNQELSKRCNAKGLYWGNPTYFTNEEIKEMKISITDIQEYANKALQNV